MVHIAVVDAPSHELLNALHFATTRRIDIVCWACQQMEGHTHTLQTMLPAVVMKNSASIVDSLDQTFYSVLTQRTSNIHFEPEESHYRIRLRVDGALHALPEATTEMDIVIITRLKVLDSLDIVERRLPQDGQFAVEASGELVSFRIATLPRRHGGKIVLRLLHQVNQSLETAALGTQSTQLTAFSQALQQLQELVPVTGSTGSGRTITLHSALQTRNTPDMNLCSVEDPVEIPIVGLNQTQIRPRADLTFQRVLYALLRQDPDIIAVGEIHDGETTEITPKAAQTGHLVLSTPHTNSTSKMSVRLQQMGVTRWMTASVLTLVITQRLVRKLCPHY